MKRPPLAPLQQALSLVDSWLTRDGASRNIVADPTIFELQQQNLPEHVRVTPKKRQGKRHAMAGRSFYAVGETTRLIADYEELFLGHQLDAISGQDPARVQVGQPRKVS